MKFRTAVRDVGHDDEKWTVYGDNGGLFTAALTSVMGQRVSTHLIDRMVTIDCDDTYRITGLVVGEKVAPSCRCCGGSGSHEYRAYVGGRSPEDLDTECSNCAGNGRSHFNTRRDSCSGYRDLVRSVHR
jgi:DnaJ-class molecular chaperone